MIPALGPRFLGPSSLWRVPGPRGPQHEAAQRRSPGVAVTPRQGGGGGSLLIGSLPAVEGRGRPCPHQRKGFLPSSASALADAGWRSFGSRGSTGELHVSSEGRLGQVWGRKNVLLTGGPLPGRRAPGWAGLGLAAAPGGGGGWAPRKSGLCWQLWALPLARAQAPEVQLGLPGRLLQPRVPGNKLTQKDNADSGVQLITPAGPRQSLLLAKDPDQHL